MSGATPEAAQARWAAVRAADGPLDAVARAATVGRAQLRHRIAVVSEGPLPERVEAVRAPRNPGVAFVYPGQGAQRAGAGRALYDSEPVYRAAIDEVAEAYGAATGRALIPVLHGEQGDVDDTRWTQPALFAVGWALTRLVGSWGIVPDAVLGHSVGELVAAAVAGVAPLVDVVRVVAARADTIADLPRGGAMVAVRAAEDVVRPLLRPGVAIAAINAPDEVVLSGDADAVAAIAAGLAADGVRTTPLTVSHAFHSPLVAAAGPAVAERIAGISFAAPTIPLYSALTGARLERAPDATFWARHVEAPVRFADAVRAAAEDGHGLFVELGPRPVLRGLGPRTAPDAAWIGALHPDHDDRVRALELARDAFLGGVRLAFRAIAGPGPRAVLPPYPFGGERRWIEPVAGRGAGEVEQYRLIEVVVAATPPHPGPLPRGGGEGDGHASLSPALGDGQARSASRLSPALGDGQARERAGVRAWRCDDAALAEVLRRGGATVDAAADRAVVRVEDADGVAAIARLAADPAVGAIAAVCRPGRDGLGRGLAAGAAAELGPRWAGLVVGDDGQLARGLAAVDGEDAVRVDADGVRAERLVRRFGLAPLPALDPQRPVLITGGTGAFGLAVADLCVDLGARRLVLLARRPAEVPAALRARAQVTVVAADVADEHAVRDAIAGLDLQGVVHAAGVAGQQPLAGADEDTIRAVVRTKAEGAAALDRATRGADLRFFVVVGSIAGIWGAPGLAAYGAANRAMGDVVAARRAAGLPAAAVAFGPVALAGGMVSEAERDTFTRAGVAPVPLDRALRAIGGAMGDSADALTVVASVDWARLGPALSARRPRPLLERVAPAPPRSAPETGELVRIRTLPEAARPGALTAVIAEVVAAVLGAAPEAVDPQAGLFDQGLDSTMAVELVARLRARLGVALRPTAAFDHPSVAALVRAVLADGEAPATTAPRSGGGEVAIVGLACRLPGAADPEALWALLRDGVDAVGQVPPGRWRDPAAVQAEAVRHGGFLDDAAFTSFDAAYFGIPDREARALDPQQRLVLEVGWEALERAGIAPDRLADRAVGVFVGAGRSEYWDRLHDPDAADVDTSYPWAGTGNAAGFVAGRLAHALGARGPAVTVDTACSSSLVALHLARRALLAGECELALAGGVNVLLSAESTLYLARIGALSPTGRCRAFDAGADGYVRGEGCGVLVLKRLADAERDGDRVLAIVRGSAIGHDGRTSGLTVPSAAAQRDVIARACADADVAPAELAVLEAHGTGTPLGDPIELGAVRDAMPGRADPLVVGSVKSNLGHLEAAAGVAAVIKVVLALQHGVVPATLHVREPNPALPEDLPVRLPDRAEPWTGRRLAGVSSFGISGTTAHVVLEGAPDLPAPAEPVGSPLLLWSADSDAALDAQLAAVDPSLPPAALASTLVHGRSARRVRVAAVGGLAELRRAERHVAERGEPRVGLLVTGQGAQGPAMARSARAWPPFARALDALLVDEALPDGLRAVLLEDDPRIDDTRWAQPALVVLALALARALGELGVAPMAAAGHSVGELAAAAICGVLSERDAVRLAVARGAAMADGPRGAMAAIGAAEAAVRPLLRPGVEIAGFNAPDEVVVSGDPDAVDALIGALPGVRATRLRTSHAFHSAHTDAALPAIARAAAEMQHAAPQRLLVSTATGDVLPAVTPAHWADQARAPVRFADAVATLARHCTVLVELGPRPVLAGLVARTAPIDTIGTLHPDRDGRTALLEAAGALWARGVPLRREAVIPRLPPIPAPTTAWQRVRQWIDGATPAEEAVPAWTLAWRPAPEVGAAAPAAVWHAPSGEPVPVVAAAARWLHEALEGPPGPLGVVTRGADLDPAHAAVWGLLATFALEHPDRPVTVVDVAPGPGVPARDDDDVRRGFAVGEPRVRVRGDPFVPRLVRAEPAPAAPVRGTWWVTGGTGALGRRVVQWLEQHGADTVLALGRAGGDGAVAVDVTDEAAVRALAADRPPDGVVHLAGTFAGGWVRDLDAAALAAVFAAKVDGARVLARVLPADTRLVGFSSAIGWLGRAGAGAYGAANAALDAVLAARGTSIAFGPWSEGLAGGAGRFDGDGVAVLSPEAGIAAFGAALAGERPWEMPIRWDLARLAARWPVPPPWLPGVAGERPSAPALSGAALRREVRAIVARTLGPIGERTGWFDAGLDSVGAVDLARRLGKALGRPLPATLLFDHPDLERLLAHLAPDDAPLAVRVAPTAAARDQVAIVSMACRFPGAASPEALWSLLLARGVPIREVPPERWSVDAWYGPPGAGPGTIYTRGGGFLDGIDRFDPEAFGIAPREAASLDPQQRLLLEVAWEALERGGALGSALRGSRTGVYVGIADRGYLQRFRRDGRPLYPDAWAGTGAEPSFAPGRVAHALGLQGPVVALNTTCSSALVATHLAVRALLAGECDQALAGGVALQLLPDDTAYLCAIGALSPTDRCHTFDARADGYVRSEGCGLVVLKRLGDVAPDERVWAVIEGTAINHDGASSGLTVPNGAAQQAVIRAALADAGLEPDAVGVLEAHGTGTPLGDPIEIGAALAVYGVDRDEPLHIGAIKANLGHTELAAGAASLIKAALALHHGTIPPHPTLERLNPALRLDGADVPTVPTPWPAGRRAGISAFGLSGTNAHVVLGRGRAPAPADPAGQDRPVHVLPLSAASAASLHALAQGLLGTGPLPDVAATVARRRPLAVRRAIVAADAAEADAALRDGRAVHAGPARVGFVFGGQGVQAAGMGLALDAAPAVREALDRAAAVLDPLLGRPLRELLADGDALARTSVAQPAILAVELAIAGWLRQLGVVPAAVAGHSLGELAAAAFAGLWSLEDALTLAFERGRIMEASARPGAMAALTADEATVRAALAGHPEVELAAFNAPDEVAVGGPPAALEAALAALPAEIPVRRLAAALPFHTAAIDPALDAWQAAVARVAARPVTTPVVSLLTARPEEDALRDPAFWRRHARAPVRCADGLRAMAPLCDVWVDVGPHPVLLGLVRRTLGAVDGVPTQGRGEAPERAWRTFAQALGGLFEAGVDVDWAAWDAPYARRRTRLALPTYPFDRRRFWLDEPEAVGPAPAYAVRWRSAVAGPAPAAVRVLGEDVLGLGARLTVRADAEVVVDLRGLAPVGDLAERLIAAPTGLAGARRWVVVTRADPEGEAYAAFVRCVGLERQVAVERVVAADADAVLAALAGAGEAPRLEPVALGPAQVRGTWWITGGLGAVGRATARWLARHGAARIVAIGRSRGAAPGDLGVPVEVVAADVADRAAMAALAKAWPPDGVVHAAGITAPQAADALDVATVRETLRAKAVGAAVLDEVLRDRTLDGFVVVSSIAAVWGSRDLGAYAAANAAAEAVAAGRWGRGERAVAVAFGPWGGGGMVDAGRAAELGRAGLRLLDPAAAAEALGRALGAGEPRVVVVAADWARLVPALEAAGPNPLFDAVRPAAPPVERAPAVQTLVDRLVALPDVAAREAEVLPHLERRARDVLRLDAGRALPATTLLADLGFDSLMATELKAALLADGLDVPLGRLLGGPSLEELANMVVARLPAAERAPDVDRTSAPADGPDGTLFWTHLAALLVGIGLASAVWLLLRS